MNELLNEFGKMLSTPSTVTWQQVFVTLVLGLVLGILIGVIYKLTYRGEFYSENFCHTLVIVCTVISMIILVIGTNVARAFSLAGALSIVRFRTSIRDPKDVAYIFMAMATGLAVGADYYLPAIIFIAVMGAALFFLNVIKLGSKNNPTKRLKITIPDNIEFEGLFDDIMKKYCNYYTMKGLKTTNLGTLFEVIYVVDLKDNINQKEFFDEIRAINGNLTIALMYQEQGIIL